MIKKIYLLCGVAPAFLILLILCASSIITVFIMSFIAGEVPWLAYDALFSDLRFLSSILFSFFIAIITTALGCIVAISVTLALRNILARSRVLLIFYQLPMAVPYLVAASGILLLFSQSGLISRMLYLFGTLERPAEFPALVHNAYGFDIIITYLWKQVPFLGILIISMLRTISRNYEEVAQTLGAGRWQRFRYVIFPLLVPALFPASVLLLAYNFGAFEVPYILGRPLPSMVSIYAYRLYTDNVVIHHAQGMAACVFYFAVSSAFVLLYMFVVRRFPIRHH